MNVLDQRHSPSQYGEVIIDEAGMIAHAIGATAPADGGAGYAKGCIFIDTDAAVGSRVLVNQGTTTSCDFNALAPVDLSTLAATAAELNLAADLSAQLPSVSPGVGITGGTGTIIKRSLMYRGELKIMEIIVDITGLGSSTTDLDVIGVAGGPAILGRVLAAEIGTPIALEMECLEAPATGVTDIILYAADEATAVFDDGIAALTNDVALVDNAGAWTVLLRRGATALPAANQYLYLVNGAAGTVGTYTTGIFRITIYGY